MRLIRYAAVAGSFMLLQWICCPAAKSHPHVFISQRIKVVFDEAGLAGFKICWRFDEFSSTLMSGDFDQNADGHLDAEELVYFASEARTSLAEHDFFTHLLIDGKQFVVRFVKDFQVVQDGSQLQYSFFVPCHVAATQANKRLLLSVYDSTYYSDISFAAEKPLELVGAQGFQVATEMRKNRRISIFFGQVNPWALEVDFSLQ